MLRNPDDAEDMVQDAFVRLYRALPRYEERQRFEPWLFQILGNCCRTANTVFGRVLRDQMPTLTRRRLLRDHANWIDRRGGRRREDPLRLATWRLDAGDPVQPEMLLQADSSPSGWTYPGWRAAPPSRGWPARSLSPSSTCTCCASCARRVFELAQAAAPAPHHHLAIDAKETAP